MTPEELKKLMDEGNKVVVELRKIADDTKSTEAEKKTAFAKMETTLANMEKANAEITKKALEDQKEVTELKEKVVAFEKVASRANLSGKGGKEVSEEMKAFEKFITKGEKSLSAEEMKYLRTDVAPDGGFLAPAEYVPEILKLITEVSPMRTVCRVRKTSKGRLEIPKRTSLIQGYWVGEGGKGTEDQSKYGMVAITAHKMIAVAKATVESLGDSAFNMESELNNDIAETFAQLEGRAILTGAGPNQPEGILGSTAVTSLNSGVAASYTGDNLITMCGRLKTGYKPIFGLNRYELAYLRTLKDGQGRYIWIPGLAEGRPSTINGYPYMEMPDMDQAGANKFPIILGDFMRGYTMVDDVVMGFIRDPYSLADEGKVKFVSYRKLGGAVTLGEAIVKLKCSL